MAEPTSQCPPPPSPHTRRGCHLCASLRHPGQAAHGRALTAHLAQHPFPRQQVTA